ncbi:tetratricopeptide repeat protein [Thiofilum flexile]|uniref:tetratricopeptide repeat protein n=1 Tax=Thiofilum flexile TaxID=125627 RepID=UPI00037E1C4F|nr:hypothetical protein [Thiofilum flexile]
MKATTELLQLLSEIGYMACFKGDIQRAKVIMDGVDAVGREQTPIKMGLAITRIYSGEYDTAIDILRNQILVNEPNHMSAKCFLGIALNQIGQQSEAQQLFREVSAHGNADEQSIANAYLNQ